MVKQLIGRGVLAGAAAGFLAFVFARIFAEPLINQAIDYEDARGAAQDALDKAAGLAVEAGGPDLVSRTVQSTIGIGTGMVLFGAAMGALVAVAYIVAVGRTGRISSFKLALLVPFFLFIGIFAVPFAKYPSNPPAVGNDDTIRTRGALYLVTVFLACVFLYLAVLAGRWLHQRMSLYWTVILAGIGYLAVMTVCFLILPPLGHLDANVALNGMRGSETPLALRDPSGNIVLDGFPADVLAEFRTYTIAAQIILWGGIALIFAPLATKTLGAAQRRGEVATDADALV
jgi:hypothetical protein